MIVQRWGWFGLILLLSGCATTPLSRYLAGPASVPRKAEVKGVPFIEQDRNQCGPASLAMVMGWAGKTVAPDELSEKMYTPAREGTFQQDLLGAARREGFLAIPIQGHDALFKEVAAGHPVLIFQNLGLSWYPVWHYSVVLGYNFDERQMLVHSNADKHHYRSMKAWDREWEGSDYWGAVILPPDKLSASADEVDHLQAAAGLERVGNAKEAESAYRTILNRWPRNLGALMGLGNVLFARGDVAGAADVLKRATQFHPQAPEAWHNLAIAYRDSQRLALARKSARYAMKFANTADNPAYRASLGTLLN